MDWLPVLAWLLTTAALPLAMATANTCCCPSGTACTRCSSGSLPFSSCTVTLGGFTESGDLGGICGAGVGCEDLNGAAYILDLPTMTNVTTCQWQRVQTLPGGTCSGTVNLNLTAAGFLIFTRTISGTSLGTTSASWAANVGAAPTDCAAFVSPMALTLNSSPPMYPNCDESASTATLVF